jgi:photosystem II stability/assembly factor-like uncharacterized protein
MKNNLLCLLFGMIAFSASAQWQHTSGPCAGNINCLAMHANNVMAGTGTGFAISEDQGNTWVNQNTGFFRVQQVNTLAMEGTILVAGTESGALYWSDDSGVFWHYTYEGLDDLTFYSSAVIDSTIFEGCYTGIYKSTDHALSWMFVSNGLPVNAQVHALAVSGTNLFAGTKSAGIFRSTDKGAHWTAVNTGFTPLSSVYSLVLNGSYLYAATGSGVFVSTDQGSNWTPRSNGLPSGTAVLSVAFKGNSILAGTDGQGIYESDNGGNDWTQAGLPGLIISALLYDGEVIIAGTTGHGAFRSTDDGLTWTPANNGLGYLYASSLAVQNDTNLFAGTKDGIYLSKDNGNSWTQVNNGLIFGADKLVHSLVVYNNKTYASLDQGIFVTSDYGSTWAPASGGSMINDAFALATTDSLIYAASSYDGVFRSSNGSDWVNTPFTESSIYSLAAEGSNLYAGCNPHIYRSDNYGNSWSSCYGIDYDMYVWSVAANDSWIFAGTVGGIYRSHDHGITWEFDTAGISYQSIMSLLTVGKRLLAGTFGGGIFFSAENGNDWMHAGNGMADTMIFAFSMNHNFIFAATPNGVWRRPIQQLYYMNLNSDSLTLNSWQDSYDTLCMHSNDDWTIQGLIPDWLGVNKISGTGSDTLFFYTLAPNPDTISRVASLVLATQVVGPTTIAVTQHGKPVGIEVAHINRVQVYPNPAHDLLCISSERRIDKLELDNSSGTRVCSKIPGEKKSTLNISDLPKGVYFLTLTGENWVTNRKIVIF